MTDVIAYMQVMQRPVYVAVALTVFMYLVMLALMRTMKLYMTKNWLPLYFIGLNRRSLIHMAVAWIKFVYIIGVLTTSSCENTVHYWMLGILVLLMIVLGTDIRSLIYEVLGDGIIAAGMLVCSFLLRYEEQVKNTLEIHAAYWILTILLAVAALMVLIREMMRISKERKHLNELGETE